MRELRIVKALEAVEREKRLDPLVEKVAGVVDAVLQPRALRDLLHGVPAGHPLHPVMVLVPTGAWISAALLDLMPGQERPARTLVGAGVLAVAPSALAGFADWSATHEQQKRTGLVHSAANLVGTALYGASYLQRLRGRQTSAKVLSFAGLGAVGIGGFIGGHLAYRQAVGANHAEDVPHLVSPGWHEVTRLDALPEGELTGLDLDGQPLVALRRGDEVEVLSSVCSHLSGPLSEGELVTDAGKPGEACVSCPWHDSVFSMRTGEVVHGPATSPQPRFDTRVVDGTVEVRLPDAG
ncbi:Rieske 2Fe-2S domain-containing protein [Frigoribacterium sp. CFBP 13707]|uniref:Rieske 2Fe-2S domain-containing protein n=1 Tax=Frigoribacterium sp. CFBP 13707 TaxID=2775313 RepID=UPI00178250D7|nr:Rieske 2Fe-2S domain-containing protein [Frigoribacterium sp. CFBP 13707]MBD8728165.1 Rieske 2Fe-2S domain-containing protein [Frigoribacterium sp. CFBP 13707]